MLLSSKSKGPILIINGKCKWQKNIKHVLNEEQATIRITAILISNVESEISGFNVEFCNFDSKKFRLLCKDYS